MKLKILSFLLVLAMLLASCTDAPAATSGQRETDAPTESSSPTETPEKVPDGSPSETPEETPAETAPREGIKLNGAFLEDYVIVRVAPAASHAATLASKIKELTGIELSVVDKGSETGGNYIYIGNVTNLNSYNGCRYKITASGTELAIDASTGALLTLGVNKLIDKYFPEKVSENEELVIEADQDYFNLPSSGYSGYTLTNSYSKELYDGVMYYKNTYTAGGSHTTAYIAVIEPERVSGIISAAPALGQRATVKTQFKNAEDKGLDVIVGINAGFFQLNKPYTTGQNYPWGVCVVDGKVIGDPTVNKDKYTEWFGITKDGKPVIGDMSAYNSLKDNLQSAVSGYKIFIKNGKFSSLTAQKEPDPRTAVAICADGSVIFICVDGRTSSNAGASYADLAAMLTSLGKDIVSAVALDGGGSTTFVTEGTNKAPATRNRPSDGSDRAVQSVLLLTVPQ